MDLPEKRKEMGGKPLTEKLEIVAPDEMLAAIEPAFDPDDYVEAEGMRMSGLFIEFSTHLLRTVSDLTYFIKDNVDVLADKDITTIKEIMALLKSASAKLTAMSETYDEAKMSNTDRKALKKLLEE